MNKYFWKALSLVGIISLVYVLTTNQNTKESITPPQIQAPTQCNKKPTPQLMEGPYYKAGTPLRTNLKEVGIVGELITITGFVYDTNCQKVVNAWLDFWQADGDGNYDNSGYKLRGHQYTDKEGKFVLGTVIPGKYPGRTPHIHVKIRASQNSPILTTQLFMPGETQNYTDAIFNKELIMEVKETEAGKLAKFNFVINN